MSVLRHYDGSGFGMQVEFRIVPALSREGGKPYHHRVLRFLDCEVVLVAVDYDVVLGLVAVLP